MKILLLAALLLPIVAAEAGPSDATNSPPSSAQALLLSRAFRLDNNTLAEMRRRLAANKDKNDGEVLLRYLEEKGIKLSPPESFFYSFGRQQLLVRSTEKKMEKIERLIKELKPQK
jgi:hypothetical protein